MESTIPFAKELLNDYSSKSSFVINAPSKEVIKITNEGAIFWNGCEIETDYEFRQAMLELKKCLISDSSVKLHMTLQQRIDILENQLECERMRLVACSVAALGNFVSCAEEYKSAALYDVLRLREEVINLRKELEVWKTGELLL
jgi:hypothetical protein